MCYLEGLFPSQLSFILGIDSRMKINVSTLNGRNSVKKSQLTQFKNWEIAMCLEQLLLMDHIIACSAILSN